MVVDCPLVITSKVKLFFRPDKTRRKEWMVQPVFCIVDAGSCYFIWSANSLISVHFSILKVSGRLCIGDWRLLHLLAVNMEPRVFGELMEVKTSFKILLMIIYMIYMIIYEYWFYWFQLLTRTLKDLRPFDICDCTKLFLRSSLTSWWTDHQEFVDQVSFVKSMYTNRLKPFILNTKSS